MRCVTEPFCETLIFIWVPACKGSELHRPNPVYNDMIVHDREMG